MHEKESHGLYVRAFFMGKYTGCSNWVRNYIYNFEKKIHPDGFTPKSNRSRRIFSFCKRVDRMVS